MEARWDWSSGKRSTGGASQEREGRVVIVIICVCGAGCLGALTAALVFFGKLVADAEFEKHEQG